jgi:hypothetical protein
MGDPCETKMEGNVVMISTLAAIASVARAIQLFWIAASALRASSQ